jgi:DNA-binding NarL/FixJ family response regulator
MNNNDVNLPVGGVAVADQVSVTAVSAIDKPVDKPILYVETEVEDADLTDDSLVNKYSDSVVKYCSKGLLKEITVKEWDSIGRVIAPARSMGKPIKRELVEVGEVPGLITRAEKEVLKLLLKGYAHKRIASELNVAEKTIKFHSGALTRVFGVSTKAELIALALGTR